MRKARMKITSRWNKDGNMGIVKLEYRNTPASVIATEGLLFLSAMKSTKQIRELAGRQGMAKLLRRTADKIERGT